MNDIVLLAMIGGVVSAIGTLPATLTALAAWRQSRANEATVIALRLQSSNEHKESVRVATAAIAVVAEKVEAQAARVAEKVEATTAALTSAIAENTTISADAVTQAKAAYEEANNVNLKIAALQREGQQQEEARRKEGTP